MTAHRIAAALAVLAAAACTTRRPPMLDLGNPEVRPVFTLLAIGDTGRPGVPLFRNAAAINSLTAAANENIGLVFLGDNFYDYGLSADSEPVRRRRFHEVYSLFEPAFGRLDGGREDKVPRYVHAVTGNHDYYTRHANPQLLPFPIGFGVEGNKYVKSRPEWAYHFGPLKALSAAPGDADEVYWTIPGTAKRVHMIFIDSAATLRLGSGTPTGLRDEETGCDPFAYRASPIDAESYDPKWPATLRAMLEASDDETVAWRIIAAHHPLYTAGEHGGYQQWIPGPNGKGGTVTKVDLCSRETAPFDWLVNSLDPEDECTCEWVSYRRRVMAAIQESGKRVHLVLAGHDHSLQLLYYPERDKACAGCPKVHVVSGAGSRMTRVKLATLDDERSEYEFTATTEAREGRSRSGFVRVEFGVDVARFDFYDASTVIRPEEMSGGARKAGFCMDQEGRLTDCVEKEGSAAAGSQP
jgi:hypothetical protein